MKSGACASVHRQLACFVGSDLGRDQAAAVAKHLAECLDCRREASSLQQSHKALLLLQDESMAPGADAEMFASLHRDTLAAVDRHLAAEGDRVPGLPPAARVLWLAAAVMLFGLGWWSVRPSDVPTLLDRDPIPTVPIPRAMTTSTSPTVLPWAGARARLRPLGWNGETEDESGNGLGSGMLRRWSLRNLVDELDPQPRRRSDR